MHSKTLEQGRTASEVPFYDLGPAHVGVRQAIVADIDDLIVSGRFTGGPQVAEFEEAFARYCGTECCVGLSNGLDALKLGLVAAGLESGDEVIVPAATFIATFEAVAQVGGRLLPVDVGESDYCLDTEATAAAVGERTRFLLPVHLFGQMADMVALAAVADAADVKVLEDACQAHGAERDGRRAGTVGFAGAFSFYPAKNLGAFGDAGALVTDDVELAARVRALREHGQRAKYRHELEGYTARLDTIQAIVLLHKLPLLDEWNEQRRQIVRWYALELAELGDLRLPLVPAGSEPVWHLFVVQTANPSALADHLAADGIGSGRHYPEPPHLSAAYSSLGFEPGSFPVTEALSQHGLTLPLFPGMREDQVARVVQSIGDYFRGA